MTQKSAIKTWNHQPIALMRMSLCCVKDQRSRPSFGLHHGPPFTWCFLSAFLPWLLWFRLLIRRVRPIDWFSNVAKHMTQPSSASAIWSITAWWTQLATCSSISRTWTTRGKVSCSPTTRAGKTSSWPSSSPLYSTSSQTIFQWGLSMIWISKVAITRTGTACFTIMSTGQLPTSLDFSSPTLTAIFSAAFL